MDYTIKQGDTLGSLAKKYGTTTANLQALNTSITDPNKIYTGGVLKVPTSTATTGVTNTSPIDASKLGTTTTPVIPPPINDTSASNNLATTVGTFTETSASNQAQAQTEADRQAKTTPTAPVNERQGIIDKITSILGIQGTQGEVSQDIYNQEGVFEKKKEVTRLEGEALAKERAYQKRAEEIRSNPQGKLESGINIDLANLDRQKNSELADIAIQYKIQQGAYADANQIAEAKVKMQFEPLENQLKTLNNLYSLYQNDLSESEKMQAQAKIQEKEADLKFKRDKELLNIKAGIDRQQAIDEAALKGVTLSGSTAQFTAANYANRLEQANQVVNQLSPNLKNMSYLQLKSAMLLPSGLQKPEIQQYSQASKNFINAVLRRESGAAISPSEFDTAYSQYLIKPGDSEAVVQQKEKNRLLVQRNFVNEAGTAYQPLSEDLITTITTTTDLPKSDVAEAMSLINNKTTTPTTFDPGSFFKKKK